MIFSVIDMLSGLKDNDASLRRKIASARKKHGDVWDYPTRETLKTEAYAIIDSEVDVETKIIAAEQIYRAWFWCSILDSRFDRRHPSFHDYCKMVNENRLHQLTGPARDAFFAKYPRKSGPVDADTAFWYPKA